MLLLTMEREKKIQKVALPKTASKFQSHKVPFKPTLMRIPSKMSGPQCGQTLSTRKDPVTRIKAPKELNRIWRGTNISSWLSDDLQC